MTLRATLLTVFCIYIFLSGISSNASQQAILIGIDNYIDGSRISPLKSASSDAQGMARILSQNGYECRTLVDKEASKELITEAFIQLEQRSSQFAMPDIFVFYFSGRGTRVPDDIQSDEALDNMDECILPSDAMAGDTLSYIRDDTLARWISAIKAKQALIILDCSFVGNEGKPEIKGFGELSVTGKVDAVDPTDGLPENATIVNASSAEGFAIDGVYTSKLLEACLSDDADTDNDRRISLDEAHKYAVTHLQGQQTPVLTGSNGSNVPLAALPALSRLQINSNPEGAKITIYENSLELPLDVKTPATVPLKKGKYGIQAQKVGFIPSDTKQVSIDEYDRVYIPDAIQLNAIKVTGKVNILDNKGKAISTGDKVFEIRVASSDKIACEEKIPPDASIMFTPERHSWLKVGAEYELTVIGQAVLLSEPVRFTYDGYSDIQINVSVTGDDIPPIMQEATFEGSKIVSGDEAKGMIKASDDGTGLDDVIDIQLESPDGQKGISILPSDISFRKPGTYEFQYRVPNDKSAIGAWKVSSTAIRDKAGNQTIMAADQINAGFTVFENHYTLGRHYFDNGDYVNAMAHFRQFTPQDDDSLYMTALAYSYQDDPQQALATFQTIKNPTGYLGNERKNMPQMPRNMVNKLWGRLLKDLKDHQKDAEYISLLAATAQELGREYDAKVYKEYISQLQKRY